MQQSLIEKTLAPVTVDGAKTSDVLECPQATSLCFMVVASAASSPTGTTIQAQGSLDGTNFSALDSAVSGLTVNSGTTSNSAIGSVSAFITNSSTVTFQECVLPSPIVTLDRTATIFVVPFASMTTASNARITVGLTAERIS